MSKDFDDLHLCRACGKRHDTYSSFLLCKECRDKEHPLRLTWGQVQDLDYILEIASDLRDLEQCGEMWDLIKKAEKDAKNALKNPYDGEMSSIAPVV